MPDRAADRTPNRASGRAVQFGWGLTSLVYPAMVFAAAAGRPLAYGLLALASFAVEEIMLARARVVYGLLATAGFGWTLRSLLRNLAAVVVIAASTHRVADTAIVAASVLLIEGARAMKHLMMAMVKAARTMRMVTRNIDLAPLKIPDQPTGFADRLTARQVVYLGILPVLGITTGALADSRYPALAGAVAGGVLGAGLSAMVFRNGIRARRMPAPGRIVALVRQRINQYAPEVVVYLSGTPTSAYQINMWLDVVADLDRRVLIVLRERSILASLAPTALPVVCVPAATDLIALDLPSVRVVLYVANAGKNIHLLRLPGIQHVFIGHGDSDKVASINPYCKVYDQVWVAGPAGRERFARAAIGVEDSDVVEVGRPQLAPINQGPRQSQGPITVLYAPTWEGWVDEPQSTSLISMGARIVATLLAHPDPIRVIYKPHPLTGTRSAAAAAANEHIVAMIARATGGSGSATASAQLARIGAELDATIAAPDADEATIARDSGMRDRAVVQRADDLTRQWSEIYWAAESPSAHRCVDGVLPTLFDCINHTDLLITDISSVVADYLFSGKPYVVTNSAGLDHDAFREAYPTAAAAELLDPDCAALPGFVTDVQRGTDRLAEQRIKLKAYLLGDDNASPLDRFRAALDRALAAGSGDLRPPSA